MIVRFNKGPWHRKVIDMPQQDFNRGYFHVAVFDKNSHHAKTYNPSDSLTVTLAPGHRLATYRLKMVKINLRGRDESVPSVFPDGAVCFEYEGEI